MELTEVSLPLQNKIALDYIHANKEVSSYFHYFPFDGDTFKERKKELEERSFPREALADYLMKFHEDFSVGEETKRNIEKLRENNSQVVIGGQQAGVLSGPLYTIHKIISIIKLAKQQEKELKIPVLPVFWIAGEDHDFDEINHLHVLTNQKVKKEKIKQNQYKKYPVSNISLDKEKCQQWIETIFETYGETQFTNELMQDMNALIQRSNTFVDFFIHVVYRLFPTHGLIVINSGDEKLRYVESSFMEKLIDKNEDLAETIFKQQLSLKEMDYGEPIEINEQSSHLFYHVNGERILLERDKELNFYGKNNECFLSEAQLLEVAKRSPDLLSNNVVSRPLMQEYLLPTLAFIGGPGEISYWSTLRGAFELFGFKIPPLVSRLNISFVEPKIASSMEEVGVSLQEVFEGKVKQQQEEWLKQQMDDNLDDIFNDVTIKLDQIHQPLRELAVKTDKGLSEVAKKNKQILETQILYMKKKINTAIRRQHDTELKKFNQIDFSLKPLGLPQERVWNIFYYLNKYGPDFIDRILELDVVFNNKHKIIYI